MTPNKVVARFKDGTMMKGTTADFFPNKNVFHLIMENGETLTVNTEQLKALFFVKDFQGDRERSETYADNIPGGGRKVQITFNDNETLTGFSQGYSPDRPGFFIIPADTKSNNERVFVIASATKKVTFL
jgi:hypothetical protein